MRKTIYFVAGLLCFLLMPAWLTAQEKTITGKITDANLTPLSGVNILISKSNKGTVTDADGQFTIAVPAAAKLIISTTGFKTQTITVAATQADLQIKMLEDFAKLDEVVVTGLATNVKRSNLSNAVGTISSKEFNRRSTCANF